ncbi:MAG: tyrosine-type recombinase/integrase [Candidatus Kuenenia sp.]|nr:tyrosine-type recombinase/integrase [Candidatus Kuenenia hertensis]
MEKKGITSPKKKISEFITEHVLLLKNETTYQWCLAVECDLEKFRIFCEREGVLFLKDINIAVLEKYKSEQFATVKRVTVANKMKVIKAMLNRAVRYDHILSNPAKMVTPVQGIPKSRDRILSNEEIPKMQEAVKGMYLENLVITALYTGMRRKELIWLDYEDVDIADRTIHIKHKKGFSPKSRKERVIPLHQKLIPLFEGKTQWICFPYYDVWRKRFVHDRRLNEKSITTRFRELMDKIGLEGVGLHTLRHTFASHCVMQGMSLKTVGEILGHSSVTMTERYSHVLTEHMLKEVDKLTF